MSRRTISEFPYQRLSSAAQLRTVDLPSEMKATKFQAKMSTKARIHALDSSCRRRTGMFKAGFKVSCVKVVKRLMDGSCHFNELFAGNYMFMQVTSSPLGH